VLRLVFEKKQPNERKRTSWQTAARRSPDVDDNSDDIELMQIAFQKAKAPCGLMSVEDGIEAIKYLSGEGKYSDRAMFPMPLLVLLDLNMPRLNGFEAIGLHSSDRTIPRKTPAV
jgi:CheY-like chemotaxis protein